MGFIPELVVFRYLSQSGCGIKSGINTTFLARNCGAALSREEQQSLVPGVVGAWTLLREMLERLRETGAWRSPPGSCSDCQQSDVAKLARRMATRAPTNGRAV